MRYLPGAFLGVIAAGMGSVVLPLALYACYARAWRRDKFLVGLGGFVTCFSLITALLGNNPFWLVLARCAGAGVLITLALLNAAGAYYWKGRPRSQEEERV